MNIQLGSLNFISESSSRTSRYRGISESFDVSKFDCGRKKYDDYLRQIATYDHMNNVGRVWLLMHHKVINGFVTIAMSQLHKSEHEKFGKITTHGYIPVRTNGKAY